MPEPRNTRKKLFVSIGGIVVFVFGAILGSFLVLGAPGTDGKTFTIKNLASSGASSGAPAHKEVPKIENYTKEFSNALLKTGTTVFSDSTESLTDSLLNQDIGPMIEAHIAELSQMPPDFRTNVASGASYITYRSQVGLQLAVLFDIFLEIAKQDMRTLADKNVREHYAKDADTVEQVINNLEDIEVPAAYQHVHEDIAIFANGLKITLENIAFMENDPARTLLLPAAIKLFVLNLDSIFRALP